MLVTEQDKVTINASIRQHYHAITPKMTLNAHIRWLYTKTIYTIILVPTPAPPPRLLLLYLYKGSKQY